MGLVYEVSFRVEGPDESDEAFVEAFHTNYEGLIAWRDGMLSLTFEFNAVDGELGCHALVEEAENVLGVRFVEAEFDLVDIPEIARRCGRSRQNIQQLVTGQRRGRTMAAFPAPMDVLDGKRIWDWGSVVEWLRAAGVAFDDEPHRLDRAQLACLNAWLCRRDLLPQTGGCGRYPDGSGFCSCVSSWAAEADERHLTPDLPTLSAHHYQVRLLTGRRLPDSEIASGNAGAGVDARDGVDDDDADDGTATPCLVNSQVYRP